jgi:hypothetical protein
MQFGREPLPKTPTMLTADGERGWVCSEHTEHFTLAFERPAAEPIGSGVAQASWEDDGGTLPGEKGERRAAVA